MFNRIIEEMEDLCGIKDTLQDSVFLLFLPEEETKKIPKWKNPMGKETTGYRSGIESQGPGSTLVPY